MPPKPSLATLHNHHVLDRVIMHLTPDDVNAMRLANYPTRRSVNDAVGSFAEQSARQLARAQPSPSVVYIANIYRATLRVVRTNLDRPINRRTRNTRRNSFKRIIEERIKRDPFLGKLKMKSLELEDADWAAFDNDDDEDDDTWVAYFNGFYIKFFGDDARPPIHVGLSHKGTPYFYYTPRTRLGNNAENDMVELDGKGRPHFTNWNRRLGRENVIELNEGLTLTQLSRAARDITYLSKSLRDMGLAVKIKGASGETLRILNMFMARM